MTRSLSKLNESSNKMFLKEKSSRINGIIRKIGSSTSLIVAITFFLTLAYKRNAFMLTFFIGSILNAITSKILKRLINQDRPSDSGQKTKNPLIVQPNDKGMPSSHAMSLGFIGMYTSIGFWDLMRGDVYLLSLVYSLLWSFVAVSLYYRVNSRLHTSEQVKVGLFFGSKCFE